MPREAGMLPFPDQILVGAQERGQRCLLPSLGFTASGTGFAFHSRLSSTTIPFDGTLSSTTAAFAIAFLGVLPGITHLQLLLEGGAVVLVLPHAEDIPPLLVCQDVVVVGNVVLEEEVLPSPQEGGDRTTCLFR